MAASVQYWRWFKYERESHAKVLESLAAVAPELRSSTAFQKALTLMAHILAARNIWLFRLGISSRAPKEFFPAKVELAKLNVDFEKMHQAWADYLDGLTDAALARKFEYRSTEGNLYRSTVQDVLTQLFGHSLYHRGQIAYLVRSLGAQPAETDFIFWSREPVPSA